MEQLTGVDYFIQKAKLYTNFKMSQMLLPGQIIMEIQHYSLNFSQLCQTYGCITQFQKLNYYTSMLQQETIESQQQFELICYFQQFHDNIYQLSPTLLKRLIDILLCQVCDHIIDNKDIYHNMEYIIPFSSLNITFKAEILGDYDASIKFENFYLQNQKLYQKLQILGLQEQNYSAILWRNNHYNYDNNISSNFFDDFMFNLKDSDLFYNKLRRVNTFQLKVSLFLASQIRQGRSISGYNINNFMLMQPYFVIEPLCTIMLQEDQIQQLVRQLDEIQLNINTYYTILLQYNDFKDQLQTEIQDIKIGTYFLHRQEQLKNQNSIKVLQIIEQIHQFLLQVINTHITEIIQLKICLIIKLILKLILLDELNYEILDALLINEYQQLMSTISIGFIEIIELIKFNPILKSNSRVQKLVKIFSKNVFNYAILQDKIQYQNVSIDQQINKFLITIIQLPENILSTVENVFYPLTNQKILSIFKYKCKDSINIVIPFDLVFSDDTKCKKVIKFSRENFIEELKLQDLFIYLNQQLLISQGIFANTRINYINCIPLCRLMNSEVLKLLQQRYKYQNSNIYVGIMQFVEFTSIYQILTNSLYLSLELKKLNLEDPNFTKISQFNKKELLDFQDKLSYSYLSEYFQIQSNIRPYALQNNFLISYVLSSLITCYFGIGDRHLDNICVLQDGQILQIDLEHAWFQGLKSKVQEIIPFRFTKIFSSLYSDNLFEQLFVACHKALFQNQEVVQFVLDSTPNPLIKQIVKQKLQCKYQGSTTIEQQVNILTKEAINIDELMKMWKGWMYWF